MKKPFRSQLAAMIGNLFEHYDNALFGLLAPFIAPLFFEEKDPLTALILTYSILPLGILMRPLGSLFFGWIGDRFGRKQALCLSLIGMAAITMSVALLPIYSQVGIIAQLLLALVRMLQSFCAAGESTGGAIFVLEHTPQNKRSLISAIYDASSMAGILIASAAVTLLALLGTMTEHWRVLFWGGGITAILGIFLRLKTEESSEFTESPPKPKFFTLLRENQKALISIILVSGFCYTTYSLAFTLMNGFIPLITTHSETDIIQVNTALLLLDMALLPLFGYLAVKWGKEKLMTFAAFITTAIAIPLFTLLPDATLATVVFVRIVIVTLGVAFSASYHAWALEQTPASHRCTILGLGYAIGSQLIGAPCSAASLWLYKQTGWSAAPALYLMAASALAGIVVAKLAWKEKKNQLQSL